MTATLAWSDAVTAAQLFAVDPIGIGGVLVRSRAGPARERWMAMLRAAFPRSGPLKHLPLHIADGRLLGGLDLNATLLAGRPVAERGLLAEALSLDTKRVQFTPDLMPGDVTGSLVYDARAGEFSFREGPVFTNLLLADEINRTPPKTQAALLEAMQERQITVEGQTFVLEAPFHVLFVGKLIPLHGLETILAAADAVRPSLLVVDSVQTLTADGLEGPAGSVGQVRESAARLAAWSHEPCRSAGSGSRLCDGHSSLPTSGRAFSSRFGG